MSHKILLYCYTSSMNVKKMLIKNYSSHFLNRSHAFIFQKNLNSDRVDKFMLENTEKSYL